MPSIGCYEFASSEPPPEPGSWDVSGSDGGGINGLDDGKGGKCIEFTSVDFDGGTLTVGIKAAKVDGNGELFGLICKTDLADTTTFTINVTLTNEDGGTATVGSLQGLTNMPRLFVVGIGPASE